MRTQNSEPTRANNNKREKSSKKCKCNPVRQATKKTTLTRKKRTFLRVKKNFPFREK
jgi:hypothetical protein